MKTLLITTLMILGTTAQGALLCQEGETSLYLEQQLDGAAEASLTQGLEPQILLEGSWKPLTTRAGDKTSFKLVDSEQNQMSVSVTKQWVWEPGSSQGNCQMTRAGCIDLDSKLSTKTTASVSYLGDHYVLDCKATH